MVDIFSDQLGRKYYASRPLLHTCAAEQIKTTQSSVNQAVRVPAIWAFVGLGLVTASSSISHMKAFLVSVVVALLAVVVALIYYVPEFSDFRGPTYLGWKETAEFKSIGHGLYKIQIFWHMTPFHSEVRTSQQTERWWPSSFVLGMAVASIRLVS